MLIDGATAHRRFGVKNNVKRDDVPKINRHTRFADILDAAQLVIIDEVSMQDRAVLEYIDKLLRYVCLSPDLKKLPFAGKVIVLGGDWKQLMPVVPGKGAAEQANHSFKNSHLFRSALLRFAFSITCIFCFSVISRPQNLPSISD